MIENISNKINVLIYGAGEAGRQLKISLKKNQEFILQGFLDDNKKLEQKNLLEKKGFSYSIISGTANNRINNAIKVVEERFLSKN